MSLLRIEKLDLDIGKRPILRDVSLSVDPGQIVGVIGESGSGKSMTAFTVMQLLPEGAVARGSVTLDGHDILTLSEPELCALRGNKVGMVFQEPMTALNPIRSIGDQVAETILIHERVSKTEALNRAREALARVELPEDRFPLTRYPHELSGGQRQRVVIAMAIALRPKLLIADEPTTALDVTVQAEILDLLQRMVRERNMAMILITHDMGVVAGRCDDVAVMYAGRIVEQAPVRDLFRNTRMPYTAALLASIPKVTDPPHRKLDAIDGRPPDLINPPPGCPFAPRCKLADADCDQGKPMLEGPAGHLFACIRPLGQETAA